MGIDDNTGNRLRYKEVKMERKEGGLKDALSRAYLVWFLEIAGLDLLSLLSLKPQVASFCSINACDSK